MQINFYESSFRNEIHVYIRRYCKVLPVHIAIPEWFIEVPSIQTLVIGVWASCTACLCPCYTFERRLGGHHNHTGCDHEEKNLHVLARKQTLTIPLLYWVRCQICQTM